MTLLYTKKNSYYVTRVYKFFAWLPTTVWEELPDGSEARAIIWFEHYLKKDIYLPDKKLSDTPVVSRLIEY